jgi:hypothetical protein
MGSTKRSSKSSTLLRAAGVAAVLLAPQRAWSQSPEDPARACVEIHVSAQHRRMSGDLLRAREELLRCSAPTCPVLIQNDCTTWMGQVLESIPSVIFSAKVGDDEIFDVSVTIDGTPVTSQLDGKRLEVNPGIHTFVFERAGLPPIEKKTIIAPRESGQIVSVSWKAPPPATALAVPAPAATPVPEQKGLSTGRILGWSSFALTLAGIGVGSATGTLMFSASDSARRECPKNQCGPGGLDAIDRAKTDATISTVAFSVGGAAAVLSAYLLLRPEARSHPSPSAAAVAFEPLLSTREAGLWIRGRFQ